MSLSEIAFSYWSKPAEDGFLYVLTCHGLRDDGVTLQTYEIIAAAELRDSFFDLSLEISCDAMRARLINAFAITPERCAA